MAKKEIAYVRILNEMTQSHLTRQRFFIEIETQLKRPLVVFFTSFAVPVSIEDNDADMLEAVLQDLDLSSGLAIMINSPGGYALAAERIINVCQQYSGTGEYWAIVPSQAKSAATMICLGASKILMGPTAELGPVDPQVSMEKDGKLQLYSAFDIVRSYEQLFKEATKTKGNLQPYLVQLANYDTKDIQKYKSAIELSRDIAVGVLAKGTMKARKPSEIKKKIDMFLSPEKLKSHGRPIFYKDAKKCGLNVESIHKGDARWSTIYELYLRTHVFVSRMVTKSIETRKQSFATRLP